MPSVRQILVLNSGSSSVKFGLFAADQMVERLASGVVERVGLPESRLIVRGGDGETPRPDAVEAPDHDRALGLILERTEQVGGASDLAAVGHRVGHGGSDCDCPLLVDRDVLERLRQLVPLAPLHQPHNLAGIEAVARRRPDLPQVACFDTAFHRSMPRVAQMTGLPRQMEAHGIRRYGFHGLSYESILDQLVEREGRTVTRERIIVAHLGNGASMAAIRGGRSVETTMGFSSLAGLLMGTRCGDLDPGLVLHLLDELGLDGERVARLLYEQSGLLGVSVVSRDMRELLARRDRPEVAEAIDLFCYRARCHLGSLTAALGGLDRLVFTGGIGANAPEIRAAICAGLDHLGIELDPRRNFGKRDTISAERAPVTVQALATDEELTIAWHTRRLAKEPWGIGIPRPKVAALSAVETVNPAIASTLDAAALTMMARRGQIAGCVLDGPLAFDNAISTRAAREKRIESEVAGDADIVLVPDLVSGNILAKNLAYLADATDRGRAPGRPVRAGGAELARRPCTCATGGARARRAAPSSAAAGAHAGADADSELSFHFAPQAEDACCPLPA